MKIRNEIQKILVWMLLVAFFAPIIWYGIRIFVADRFVVNGISMAPTLHKGRGVWVNKLLMGPRIYTKFDFYGSDLHCFRMPGLRRLRIGDVAVFNYPYGSGDDSISFNINYTYCKRCWGAPGDTIEIKDGIFGLSLPERHPFNEGYQMAVRHLRSTSDLLLKENGSLLTGQFAGEDGNWTLKNFGPIVVPKKGMTIVLDSTARRHYAGVISWEKKMQGSSKNADPDNDRRLYTFLQDWYFFVGDNLTDSQDSRYFGFVPENFVIGVVPGL